MSWSLSLGWCHHHTCLIGRLIAAPLTDETTISVNVGAPKVLLGMTMALSLSCRAKRATERLSGCLNGWFLRLVSSTRAQGVLWSVILDPELHSGRIRNPKDLWGPTSPSTVTESPSHLRQTRRRCLGGVTKRCRQNEPAILLSLATTSRTLTVCLGHKEIFWSAKVNTKGSEQQWCKKGQIIKQEAGSDDQTGHWKKILSLPETSWTKKKSNFLCVKLTSAEEVNHSSVLVFFWKKLS